MPYDSLLKEAAHQGIHTYEKPLKPKTKGLYADSIIWINKNLASNIEKTCILAEELGHHHTTVGNILDQSKLTNRKQENRARGWAYEKLVPLSSFIEAHRSGIRNRHELAEFLCVTEDFLESAIVRYKEKYGLLTGVDQYILCFEPLGVLEMFE